LPVEQCNIWMKKYMQELLTVGANISMRDQLREAREYAINDA
jgi:hypothetical protein